jgi:hypothetical protein
MFKNHEDFRKFVQETEDRAERRVREELREKILEEMDKIVHRDLPLWSQIRNLVLNLL